MQNLYFGPPLIIGIALIALGVAPIGIPMLVLVAAAAAYRFSNRAQAEAGEGVAGQDAHTKQGPGTGYAYKGQAHMTPDTF